MTSQPRARSEERSADIAVKKTLSYRSVFDYPMTINQIGTFLITNRKISYKYLVKSINKLTKQGLLKVKDEKYYLKGVKPLSWDLRSKNTRSTLKNLEKIHEALGKIPWIKLLAVTGSAAAYNLDKKDDIDIFIITDKNRVWLTRLFTVLILKALGKYRTDKNYSNKICPNLFIDETNISWSPDKRNVYVAHEILMMQPVINKNDTYFKFLKKNEWVYDFFANSRPEFLHDKYETRTAKNKQSNFVDLLEEKLMNAQLRYMKNKQTEETTKKGFIHFNKNDWSEKILKEYTSHPVNKE